MNVKLPISYSGNKYKIINDLKKYIPNNMVCFYEVFGGSLTVGANIEAENIFYNDINIYLKKIIEYFFKTDLKLILKQINENIKIFKLKKENKESYYNLRKSYNKEKTEIKLFLLLVYGFQNQIRFNSKHEFNNPIGKNDYNLLREKELISFIKKIKNKKIKFYSFDFKNFIKNIILNNTILNKDKIVYLDPPYLITTASYNDGKRGFSGWNENEEKELLCLIEKLNKNNIKFILSNVIEHKNKKNNLLENWYLKNNFNLIQIKHSTRKEILIKNF